jgi:hypothetical protein
MLKTAVRRALDRLGHEVRHRPAQTPAPAASTPAWSRVSWQAAGQRLRDLGWQPRSVADVGAAAGDFTRACREIFPETRYLLVEPLQERQPALKQVAAQGPQTAYAIAAAERPCARQGKSCA